MTNDLIRLTSKGLGRLVLVKIVTTRKARDSAPGCKCLRMSRRVGLDAPSDFMSAVM